MAKGREELVYPPTPPGYLRTDTLALAGSNEHAQHARDVRTVQHGMANQFPTSGLCPGVVAQHCPAVQADPGSIPQNPVFMTFFCFSLQLNLLLYMHAMQGDSLMSLCVPSSNDSRR